MVLRSAACRICKVAAVTDGAASPVSVHLEHNGPVLQHVLFGERCRVLDSQHVHACTLAHCSLDARICLYMLLGRSACRRGGSWLRKDQAKQPQYACFAQRTVNPEAGDVVAACVVLGALGRPLVSSSCRLSDVSNWTTGQREGCEHASQRTHAEVVVLAHVDDGQAPQGGDIVRLKYLACALSFLHVRRREQRARRSTHKSTGRTASRHTPSARTPWFAAPSPAQAGHQLTARHYAGAQLAVLCGGPYSRRHSRRRSP